MAGPCPGRRAKLPKLWDTWAFTTTYMGYFSCQVVLSSVWIRLGHFGKDFSKATSPPVFIQLQPNFIL